MQVYHNGSLSSDTLLISRTAFLQDAALYKATSHKNGVCQVFCVSFKKNFYGEGNLPIVRVLYFYKLTRQSILDKHLHFIV